MHCYTQSTPQQPAETIEQRNAAEVRRLKRELKRVAKSVRSAVDQAEEEANEIVENTSDREKILILSDAIESLRNKLGFLSDES